MTKATICRVCGTLYQTHWAKRTICPGCDIRASGFRLTDMQQAGVAILATANAFTRERAFFSAGVKPLVMGKLRDLELVQSRVVNKHRAQRTHYWLTSMGRELSRRRGAGQ